MKKILLSLISLSFAIVGLGLYYGKHESNIDTTCVQSAIVETSKTAGHMPEGDWLQRTQRKISEQEYHIRPQQDGKYYSSPNRKNNLRFTYRADGFSAKPRVDSLEQWAVNFQVVGLLRGEEQVLCLTGTPKVVVEGSRMIQHFDDGFHIEYKNAAEGMRQNFYVEKKANGKGELRLRLQTSGSLFPVCHGEDGVDLVGKEQANGATDIKARYADLKVFDASGAPIPAKMEVSTPVLDEYSGEWVTGIDLVVDDVTARYPLLIDPTLDIPVYGSDSAAWEGNQAGAYFGYSVSSAGDVNGDGYSDVVIGAPFYDFVGAVGAAFVYHGSAMGLDSNTAIILTGNQVGGQFGYSVSTAGDVNRDGFSDIIIGAVYDSTVSGAYVYKGSSNGVIPTEIPLTGGFPWTEFGCSVASAGDLNNDGYSDVVVGAQSYASAGAFFVYLGNAVGIGQGIAAQVVGTQAGGAFGNSVACAGDVNGDGFSDLIVGAMNSNSGNGASFVYHGGLGGIITTPVDTLTDLQPGAGMGTSVASAGDVNGDGYSDVIVGAPIHLGEGAAFIYLGSTGGVLLPASDTIFGVNQPGSMFGFSVACAGDMNGDGYSDVVVGANYYDSQNGIAFLYAGSAAGIGGTFTQLEPSTPNANFGHSVASAGDINGDGYSDLIIGAPFYSNPEFNEGGGFIYTGSPNGCDTLVGAILDSAPVGSQMGTCVNSAGDVNGDGFSDVVVSAPQYGNGQFQEGAAFIYHGSAMGISPNAAAIIESNVTSAELGWAASSAGDVNGDGYSDVVVRSTIYDARGNIHVYHGSSAGIDTAAQIVLRPDFDINGYIDWVSSAGDVNGDGFGDIIAATSIFGSGQNDEASAIVYLGSSAGILPTPAAIFESNFGNIGAVFCNPAGDVNGDGYSDVVIGAPDGTNDQTNEGLVWVILGSECGLDLNSALFLDGNLSSAGFGCSVASGGDINGDGYSDVIVGSNTYANGEIAEGAAYIFYGSPLGIDSVPSVVLESNVANLMFGNSVAGAGDVNGDGYGDIVIGTSHDDNAFVFLGSQGGIVPTPSSRLHGAVEFGWSVASAGDINNDGYSEVIVGTPDYGGTGGAFVFYGNGGGSTGVRLNQFRPGSNIPVAPGGLTGTSGQATISMNAKSFLGSQGGKLVWELASDGQPFSSAGGKITNSVDSTGASTAYTDLIGLETTIMEELSGLSPSTDYKWRARIKYAPSTAITGQMYGPWFYYKSRTPEVPMLGFKTEAFPSPEITVIGNHQIIQNGDTMPTLSDSTDFGFVATCGYSAVHTFTIRNEGNKVMNLSSPTIGGMNPLDFSVSMPPATSIVGGDSSSFEIAFSPAGFGLSKATISIITDDCNEDIFVFAIQGVGVTDTMRPNFDSCLSNQVIVMEDSCVGIVPDFIAITQASDNCGQPTVTQPAPFAIGSVLNNLDSTYSVSLFAEDANGNRDTCTFNLTIAGFELEVSGNGIAVPNGDTLPGFQDSTDFGDLPSCKESSKRQFTILNQGSETIRIDSVGFTGANPADFRIPDQPVESLVVGGATNFEVVFDPIAGGSRKAIANIYANGCTVLPYQFAIQGNVLTEVKPVIYLNYGEFVTTTPFLAYTWFLNGTTELDTTPTITPTMPGYYSVQALDADGCRNESSPLYFDPNSVHVNPILFISYPNPSQDAKFLNLQVLDSMEIGAKMVVSVLNVYGQEMSREEFEEIGLVTKVDIESLERGFYQLVISIGQKGGTINFMKL